MPCVCSGSPLRKLQHMFELCTFRRFNTIALAHVHCLPFSSNFASPCSQCASCMTQYARATDVQHTNSCSAHYLPSCYMQGSVSLFSTGLRTCSLSPSATESHFFTSATWQSLKASEQVDATQSDLSSPDKGPNTVSGFVKQRHKAK